VQRDVACTTVCGWGGGWFGAGIDPGRTGHARPACPAAATVADQQPAGPAVAAITAGLPRGGGVGAVAAVTADAEQPGTPAAAAVAVVDPDHSGPAGAAVADQQPTGAAVLPGRTLIAVADQQPGVGIVGGTVTDEDPDQCAERITAGSGWNGGRGELGRRGRRQRRTEQPAARQWVTTGGADRRRQRQR